MMLDLEQFEGSEIAGRFKLGKLLGKGGYGAVFEARQISMQRQCAVKLLHQSLLEDDNIVERFRAEAIATSKLSHPNSVVVYDFGMDEAQGLLFIAMEFLEGGSLNELISKQGPLPLDVVLHLVDQIAASLQDAHDRGIVHRDIKPHNIMVVPRSHDPYGVKVIDFGIAKILEETTMSTMEKLTRTGVMVGTPHYMAPEQIRDEKVDGRTDMYALAMCVYKMLTGRLPFSGGTAVDVACRQLTDLPKPLRVYKPKLPVDNAFEDALLKALSKDKDSRYATVGAFAKALRHAARHLTGDLAVEPSDVELKAGATPVTVGAKVTSTAPMNLDVIAHDKPTMDHENEAFAPTLDDTPRPRESELLRTPLPQKDGVHANRSTMLLFPMTADDVEERIAQELSNMPASEASTTPMSGHVVEPRKDLKVRQAQRPVEHTPVMKPAKQDDPQDEPFLPNTIQGIAQLPLDEPPASSGTSRLHPTQLSKELPLDQEITPLTTGQQPQRSLLPVLVVALLVVSGLLGLLVYGVMTR